MEGRKKRPPQWIPESPLPTDVLPRLYAITITPQHHKLSGFFLSDRYRGYQTHWMGSRTLPCLGSDTACPGCKMGLAKRWKGFAAVQVLPNRKKYILELPFAAVNCCKPLQAQNGSLRGLHFAAQRMGPSANAPVKILLTGRVETEPIEPEFDVFLCLLRWWGYDGCLWLKEQVFRASRGQACTEEETPLE
jgi:hypothetical protein